MGVEIPASVPSSPGLRAMWPLLYAAWADRSLNMKEINGLRKLAAELPFLKNEDKLILMGLSDPATPPGRERFKLWETEIRRIAATIPEGHPPSLAELCARLGAEADTEHDPAWWADQLPALQALENGLGRVGEGVYRSIFDDYDSRVNRDSTVVNATTRAERLQRILDGEAADMMVRMKEILMRPSFERHIKRDKEDYRAQVLGWMQELADEGIGALAFDEPYGGQGDMRAYAYAMEAMAYHDLSLTIRFGVQFGLWGGAVANLGTEEHHNKYLKGTGTLEIPGCFAMTETGHGSNVRGLETTAVYDPKTDEIIVHSPSFGAGKEYIGNALYSTHAAVFAQLIVGGESQGVHAVVVPLRDSDHQLLPGITAMDNGYKMGLNGIDNGRLWFEKVRVPRANLLNRFGGIDDEGNYYSSIENPSRRFFTMLGTLVGGRVCVPRAGLSAAKSALTIAVRHGLRRRQFGADQYSTETLLLDYPNQQRRLIPRLAKAYASHFALDYLLDRFVDQESEEEMREIEALAAGMKSYVTWFTTDCIQECREATGGKGYLSVNRFADLKADTDIFTTFEGDNTVLMQLVAKSLLSDFKKAFQEDGNLAILRFLGRRISTVITEQNPVVIRQTDRSLIDTPGFYQAAFQFRDRRLTQTLASRFRTYLKEGMDAFSAALRCQTHMMEAAEAWIERITLDQFLAKLDTLPTGPEKRVLSKLCALYAVHTIEQHRGWYLESNYIAGVKSKAIRKLVDMLCTEIRPDVGVLVDAFGIPDDLLGAPIGRKD
ncbi:MAG: acyl-CoA dehydrogenase [Bacteroidota bacterium]